MQVCLRLLQPPSTPFLQVWTFVDEMIHTYGALGAQPKREPQDAMALLEALLARKAPGAQAV